MIMNTRDEGKPGGGLTFRNAIADWDHVPSAIVARGRDDEPATVTIAILTYRRPELLVEAVESALRQDWDRPFRIIVVDDDPASQTAEFLLERLPVLKEANFRYFVNSGNLGIFGNWNRSIQLADTNWMTVLSDDDQLDSGFLRLMFSELDKDSRIDGLVCRDNLLDERPHRTEHVPPPWRRRISRALLEYKYGGRTTRRIKPHRLFWEAVVGSASGFVFRTQAAKEVGGYYPEEFPTSDWWFYVRFSKRFHLRQHRGAAVSIRVGAMNESAKLSTIKQGLQSEYRLQQALAGSEVPGWWIRFTPLILANHRRYVEDFWNANIPEAELEQALNLKLSKNRPRLYKVLQIVTRGL
jgi:glycosyltransferase involved in cell wall biosynthesis